MAILLKVYADHFDPTATWPRVPEYTRGHVLYVEVDSERRPISAVSRQGYDLLELLTDEDRAKIAQEAIDREELAAKYADAPHWEPPYVDESKYSYTKPGVNWTGD